MSSRFHDSTVSQSPVLVTGGAGFIGSTFVRQWLAEETSAVVVLDKLTYAGSLESLADVQEDPRFYFQQGDIADEPLVAGLLSSYEPWAIVNFAAESHVDRSIDAPAPFLNTNFMGTWHLLEAALRYWRGLNGSKQAQFRFLHISTDEVFGSIAADAKSAEDWPYAPSSPYGASKAAADHVVRAFGRTYGLPALITYSSNNYGPFQFPEKLVPLIILNALEGRALPVYGDGSHVRDWIFVDDHCRALRKILAQGKPGEAFNVAADGRRSNLALVREICATVDRLCPELPQRPSDSLIEHVADRPGHDERYALDTSKIQAQIGWQPRVDLTSGLETTVRWYLENPLWVLSIAEQFDRGQRLGTIEKSDRGIQ